MVTSCLFDSRMFNAYRRLATPFFCQVPFRNSGLLLRLPITFDDVLMSEASQRRTSLRPSLYDTSSHASLVLQSRLPLIG